MKTFKFSVIIPTYNRAERLKIALDSLSFQTYKNFEVVVCDDGSIDHTKEVVESFSDKLSISYVWEENWGGPARPRNNGIKASKADWICFLDSDDWWYPEKLERCLPLINKYDLIFHELDVYNTFKKISTRHKSRKLPEDIFNDLLLKTNYISNSSVVVKKSLLIEAGGLTEDRDLISIEDFDMWLKIARKGYSFYYIETPLGGYLKHETNITADVSFSIEKEKKLLLQYKNELEKKFFEEVWARNSYKWGRCILLSKKNIYTSKNHFRNALKSTNYLIKIKSIISLADVIIHRQ